MAEQAPESYVLYPSASLEATHPPAFLVYAPPAAGNGTTHIVGFGADQLDEARTVAERLSGVVVAVPVLAAYQ